MATNATRPEWVGRLPANEIVFESWQRSAAAGVSPDSPVRFRSVPDAELRRRQADNRRLIDVAVPHLRWLANAFVHRPRVAYLVDRDGIVLHAEGDEAAIIEFGLSPGFDWSEATMGTSGAGTALAAKRPVAIVGCDHWSSAWAAATCLGAPIQNRDGQIIGAIDLSLDLRDGDADRLVVPSYAAYAISHELAYLDTEANLRSSDALNRQKDTFVATLAHELRQPLAAMHAAVGVMRGRRDRAAGERARLVVERQIEQLAHLVDDLLDAGRIAQGKVRLDCQRIAVDDVVATVLATLAPEAERRALHVDASGVERGLYVNADPHRLHQVFSNLLTNAMKFSFDGGMVTVRCERDANRAVVRLRDSGRGIAAELVPHIFDLFTQADPDTGGLGIGLAVVRGLIDAHGGTVEARSEGLGRGSEFIVSLPLPLEGS
jgi:signal transduction histidine kinase